MGTRSTTQARAPRLVTLTRSTVGSPAAAFARIVSDCSVQRADRSGAAAAWLCGAVSGRAARAAEAADTAMAARMRMRVSPCRGRTGYGGRGAPARSDDRYVREVAPVCLGYPVASLLSPARGAGSPAGAVSRCVPGCRRGARPPGRNCRSGGSEP
ncbi:hypothetical protein GCM10017687_04300 [Streptomyces echinatus]